MVNYFKIAAVAASVLSSSGPVAARTIVLSPDLFEISVLGGQTFRVNQAVNTAFVPKMRGQRALVQALTKFGATPDDALLLLLEEILQELGLIGGGLNGGNRPGQQANSSANANQGMFSRRRKQ